MRKFTRATVIAPAALLALVLGVVGAVMGPAPTAQAEAGYRVCGVFNSARDGNYGTGLAVKIYKDDKNNDTCTHKSDYIRQHYAEAYPGSSGLLSFAMVTCEVFGARIGLDKGADICPEMNVNKIYFYTSHYDAQHPVDSPAVRFWRD